MSEQTNALKELGLSENEASTYVTLLRMGSTTPSELSQKTNIHRINLYDLLKRLQEKGLVSYSIIGKRKYYEATEPKVLLAIMEEKKKTIEGIVPFLEKEKVLSKKQEETTIFKDKAGIKTILVEMTKSGPEILLQASGWGFRKNFPEYYDAWHQRLYENGVKLKTIASEKQRKEFEALKKIYKCKYLPTEEVFPSTTAIFGNNVFILIWLSTPVGILIRSHEVAESHKKYFNFLWEILKA
ncbi:MAG: helix-turn-helix domain-containing protein [archaeon]